MQKQIRRWHIYPSISELEAYAARAIVRAAAQSASLGGHFTIVLAGGRTPQRIYERLVETRAAWERWYIYFGDERCLPVGHSERNDTMAYEAWLKHVPIPKSHVYSMPAELGADEAAHQYGELLQSVDQLDFALLGLGEDGHTASLFPGLPGGRGDTVAVHGAPKPPAERVSLSAPRLSRAKQVMFVVSGEGKRDAVRAWRRGDNIPAGTIAPEAGVDILLDIDAWPDRFE